jgi:acyl-CoA synthetase (NDP forming)
VPHLPEEIRSKLRNLLKTEAGTILINPVDLSADAWELGFYNILNILSNYDGIDLIMVHFALGLRVIPPPCSYIWDSLMEDVIKARGRLTKPLIAVIHIPTSDEDYEWMLKGQRECYEAGIPVYHSISSAAKAVDRFLHYHEQRLSRGQG